MSDKYKNEIEEILRNAEEVMPKGQPGPAKRTSGNSGGFFSTRARLPIGRGLKISAGKLMLGSLGLFLLALVLGAATNISVVFLVVAGLVVFVIAYALFFVRPSGSSSYEKRWRGRVIEGAPAPWDRFKRWLKG